MWNKNRCNKYTDTLTNKVENITSREDLRSFINDLLDNYKTSPSEWENDRLESYLEAMDRWIQDMDGYYKNVNETFPENVNWKVIGQILLAAKYYE